MEKHVFDRTKKILMRVIEENQPQAQRLMLVSSGPNLAIVIINDDMRDARGVLHSGGMACYEVTEANVPALAAEIKAAGGLLTPETLSRGKARSLVSKTKTFEVFGAGGVTMERIRY